MKEAIIFAVFILIGTASIGQIKVEIIDFDLISNKMLEQELFIEFYKSQEETKMQKGIKMVQNFKTQFDEDYRRRVEHMPLGKMEEERNRTLEAMNEIREFERSLIESLNYYEKKYEDYIHDIIVKYFFKYGNIQNLKYAFDGGFTFKIKFSAQVTKEIIRNLNLRNVADIRDEFSMFIMKIVK